MAEEVISAGSEAGAGDSTTTQEGPEQTSQEAGQNQSSVSCQVDTSTSQTSSKKGQGRENFSWLINAL